MTRFLRCFSGYRLICILFLLCIINSSKGFALSNGDYVATTSGTWNNAANWSIWHGSFFTMTPAPDYPGQNNATTYNVTIDGLFGITTMTVDASPPFSIASLTIGGLAASACTNFSTLTITGNLSGGSGTFTQGINSTLNIGGSLSVNVLQATASGNTINYTAANPTIYNTTYFNLTFSGSGAIGISSAFSVNGDLTLSGTITATTLSDFFIGGNLTIGDGNILTSADYNLTVNGTTTVGSGTGGKFSISSVTSLSTKTFGGLIRVNAGATWDNSNSCPIFVENGITNNGTFNATSPYTFNTNDQALTGSIAVPNATVTGIILTNNNTFTVSNSLSGTGTLTQAANATLNISGTSTIASLLATNNGNTVNYNGTSSQTVFSTDYYNLTLSSNGTDILQTGTSIISGNFILSGSVSTTAVTGLAIGGDMIIGAGTSIDGSTFSHSIGGNFSNNGTFTQGTTTMTFNGSSGQTIGGSVATTFYNLTINNTNGVSLDDGTNSNIKTVTNALTLSNGYLTTTSVNLLILNSGVTTTVANSVGGVPQNNSPYIDGPVRKIGSQAFIFPVGAVGTGCVPIGISAPGSATDAFDAQYIRSSAKALGPITSPNLYNVSICEYWILNRTTGSSTVDVTAYWNQNSPCNGEVPGNYVTDLTTISLAHFDGSSWDDNSTSANSFTTGGTISGGITWSNVSTFSPFALGNNTAAKTNPLDIKILYFTATKSDGYNQLAWKAECTASSNMFEVQRSYDGIQFNSIDTVNVSSASDCSKGFTYNDYDASGTSVYYRLKTTDASGVVNYSDIKLITNDANSIQVMKVIPNPVQNDAIIKISAAHPDKVELVLLSFDGKELYRNSIQVQTGTNIFNLHAGRLAKGMYIVKGVFEGGSIQTIKFVKD